MCAQQAIVKFRRRACTTLCLGAFFVLLVWHHVTIFIWVTQNSPLGKISKCSSMASPGSQQRLYPLNCWSIYVFVFVRSTNLPASIPLVAPRRSQIRCATNAGTPRIWRFHSILLFLPAAQRRKQTCKVWSCLFPLTCRNYVFPSFSFWIYLSLYIIIYIYIYMYIQFIACRCSTLRSSLCWLRYMVRSCWCTIAGVSRLAGSCQCWKDRRSVERQNKIATSNKGTATSS